ncbi:MAG: hypothetical protein QM759_05060 [Terricaulis sp.]
MALKSTRCVTFERLLDDGRVRLLRKQDPATAFDSPIFVSDGRRRHSIAALDARGHLLDRLSPKLLAFQFPAGDGNSLVVAALRRVLKAKVRTVHDGVEIGETVPQLPIETRPAREALEIIKYDNVPPRTVLLEVLQHTNHAGSLHVVAVAGLAVRVDRLDHHTELCCGFGTDVLGFGCRRHPAPVFGSRHDNR